MENVLAAFVTVFLILASVLTLSGTFLSSQDTLRAAWQAMQTRADARARTHLSPVHAQAIGTTTALDLTFRNDGESKLSDFGQWDVIVEYFDDGNPAGYHVNWLAYTTTAPAANQWTVEGIYLNVEQNIPEAIERGILNPGEELVLRLGLDSPIGIGKTIQITLATANGISASMMFTPDAPPVLSANAGLTAAKDGATSITADQLSTTDGDDQPAALVYTITTPPRQGTLNMGTVFTQLAIDNGLLNYTQTGSGPDSFAFTVSDGKTIIGPYTFAITINNPPTLAANVGLAVADGQTAVIDKASLATADPDDQPANLTFTVTTPPQQGTLSLGNTFTQAAIDNGLLSYTRTGSGPDSFTFKVSDGHSTIGSFTLPISEP